MAITIATLLVHVEALRNDQLQFILDERNKDPSITTSHHSKTHPSKTHPPTPTNAPRGSRHERIGDCGVVTLSPSLKFSKSDLAWIFIG